MPWKTKAELHNALDANQVCSQPDTSPHALLGLLSLKCYDYLLHAQITACSLDPHLHSGANLCLQAWEAVELRVACLHSNEVSIKVHLRKNIEGVLQDTLSSPEVRNSCLLASCDLHHQGPDQCHAASAEGK